MRTTATMMFGSIDTPAERVDTCGASASSRRDGRVHGLHPLDVRATNTALAAGPSACHRADYLRLLAVSRVFLDNVANLQASWVTQGLRMGQVALSFGANDMGSTMIEENVVRAAGVVTP